MAHEDESRGSALRLAAGSMLVNSESTGTLASPANSGEKLVTRRRLSRPLNKRSTVAIAQEAERKYPPGTSHAARLHFWDGTGAASVTTVGNAGSTGHSICRRRTIDLSEGLARLRMNNQSEQCSTLAFSSDSGRLAGGFFDGFLRIFDAKTGAEQGSCSIPPVPDSIDPSKSPTVTCLRWMPATGSSHVVATVDTAGSICLWCPAPSGRPSEAPMQCAYQTRGGAALQAICFAHDQKRLAVGGVERKISVYDIQEGAPIMNLGASPAILGEDVSPLFGSHHRGTIVCLRADPVNPEVMYSGSIGRQIFRWDLRVGPHAVGLIRGPRLSGDAMDISKDGQQLLTGSHCGRRTDKPLSIYDLRSFETPAATLSDASMSFSWCADEPAVGVTAKQSSCMLLGVSWDSQTNRVIAAAGEQDNVAKAFVRQEDPARPLQTVGSLQNNAAGFLSTAVSPDGSRVAFGSVDGTVHLAQLSKR